MLQKKAFGFFSEYVTVFSQSRVDLVCWHFEESVIRLQTSLHLLPERNMIGGYRKGQLKFRFHWPDLHRHHPSPCNTVVQASIGTCDGIDNAAEP